MWTLFYTSQAKKDSLKIKESPFKNKTKVLLELLKDSPLQSPPPFEKLRGDLIGAYSRRINYQHRLVYQILREQKRVKIIRMWSHYE